MTTQPHPNSNEARRIYWREYQRMRAAAKRDVNPSRRHILSQIATWPEVDPWRRLGVAIVAYAVHDREPVPTVAHLADVYEVPLRTSRIATLVGLHTGG
jgi:hypothetical protein